MRLVLRYLLMKEPRLALWYPVMKEPRLVSEHLVRHRALTNIELSQVTLSVLMCLVYCLLMT